MCQEYFTLNKQTRLLLNRSIASQGSYSLDPFWFQDVTTPSLGPLLKTHGSPGNQHFIEPSNVSQGNLGWMAGRASEQKKKSYGNTEIFPKEVVKNPLCEPLLMCYQHLAVEKS